MKLDSNIRVDLLPYVERLPKAVLFIYTHFKLFVCEAGADTHLAAVFSCNLPHTTGSHMAIFYMGKWSRLYVIELGPGRAEGNGECKSATETGGHQQVQGKNLENPALLQAFAFAAYLIWDQMVTFAARPESVLSERTSFMS